MSFFSVIFVNCFDELLITNYTPSTVANSLFLKSLFDNLCKISKWFLNSVVHAQVYSILVAI